MKYYLFIDNFRGFSDTCIPITDVNFLVGENSTGKTSILGLVKLFSGGGILMGKPFSDEHVGFGHFGDMVSANSANQSYFRIGFVWEQTEKRKRENEPNKIVLGSLFTFTEKDGIPRLFKCTLCRGTEKITLRFGNSIFYKKETCTAAQTAQEFTSTLRSQWVNEHSSKDHGYAKIPVPSGFGDRFPIFLVLSFIGHVNGASTKKQKKSGQIVLHRPDIAFVPPDLIWLAPIRTKPKRTYDELALAFSPEGQHTPYLIRKMLHSKPEAVKFKQFIDKIGNASGLFQDVQIRNFGRGSTARFELDIVIDGKALNVLNVGYGVSQSLPVMVELLARDPGTCFAIQQPEIHLHPRAQSALGDVLFEMAATDHKLFLVETHSDFTIDRFRMNYKSGRSVKPDSQILFFERRDKHNIITPLSIGKFGELPTDQPDSYRQFFIREQKNLLGI
jgi:hypothetical protein